MASLDAPSSMPILVTRRAEEEHERPSLCAELTMLLTSPDAYIAALALLVGFLTPEALPQHQRGAPRNSSGLLSNVYLDDSEQACPHAHAMHTPCTRHATPSARHAHTRHGRRLAGVPHVAPHHPLLRAALRRRPRPRCAVARARYATQGSNQGLSRAHNRSAPHTFAPHLGQAPCARTSSPSSGRWE